MIVPIGINHVIRGWPRVTIALIVACTLVHTYGETIAPSAHDVRLQIEHRVDVVPPGADDATQEQAARDIEDIANQLPSYRFGYRTDSGLSYRAVTSAFVHVGWFHLIGNMLFLWLAGAALEDRWGRARLFGFYLAGAFVSALGFSLTHHGDVANLVGASGAVSALMGAFLVYFARTQIHFVYWIGLGSGRFDAVAYAALPLWFAEQVLYAQFAGEHAASSVAFTAHISGFIFGVVVAAIAKFATSEDEDAPEQAATEDAPKAVARVARPSRPAIRPSAPAVRRSAPPVRPSAPPFRPPAPPAPPSTTSRDDTAREQPDGAASGPRFLK